MQPLRADPRQDLDPDLVAATLALTTSPKIQHGYDLLDLSDVVKSDETLPVDEDAGGSVTWSYRPPDATAGENTAAVAEVRRRATITLTGDITVNLNARRIRLWSEMLMADGAWARFHSGVFLFTLPGASDDGVLVRRQLQLPDKSYDWANAFITEPLEVTSSDGAVVDWIKADMAAEFGETAFAIGTSADPVDEPHTFETGTSRLEVYSKLLEAIGFDQLTADENGRPASQSLAVLAAKGIEHTYGAGQGKILRAGSVEPLLPTLPNVVRFSARQGPSLGNTEGDGLYTVYNQSTGPASIDARGGREVLTLVHVDVDTQDALVAYGDANAQRYFAGGGLRFTGQVGFNPRHGDRDVVGIDLPRLDASGTWLVTSWELPRRRITSPEAVLMNVTAERRVT